MIDLDFSGPDPHGTGLDKETLRALLADDWKQKL